MRRTFLSALALGCTAVLAGTVPAFADGASPVPSTRADATVAPSPVASTRADATVAPSPVASTRADATVAPSPVASTRPDATVASAPSQVAVVPKGAPDTGAAPVSAKSGSQGELIGGGAAAVFAVGGATVLLVRRRRATGA